MVTLIFFDFELDLLASQRAPSFHLVSVALLFTLLTPLSGSGSFPAPISIPPLLIIFPFGRMSIPMLPPW